MADARALTYVFLVAVWLVAIGGTSTAEAQQRAYVIAVPMDDEIDPLAARVGAAARASLRGIEGVEWEGPDRAFLGYSDFVVERLRRARERLEEGRQAYVDLDLGRAIDLLSGAVEDFDAAAPALEDPTDLAEALLFLGACQVFDGRQRDARRTFTRVHLQMPYVVPDPNLFNPDIITEFDRARPRAGAGSITVDSEPTGAIVYVDYVARGRAPVTVNGLGDGSHVVRVTRPGATPYVQEVDLRRGRAEQVTAFLEDNEATPGLDEALQELRSHDLDRVQEGDAISRIALALELDRVGVIQVSPGGSDEQVQLRFVMFEVANGSHAPALVGSVPTAFGDLEAGVRRLVGQGLERALAGATTEGSGTGERRTGGGGGGGGDEFTQPPPDDEPAIYEQWWFWTIIGAVVVVGAAVAIGVAASSGGQDLGGSPGGQIVLEF